MEAEYVSAVTGMQEALLFQHILQELLFAVEPIRVSTDSSAAKASLEKPGFSGSHVKHMQLRYAFAKDLAKEHIIVLRKVSTFGNPADMLTKPVPCEQLTRCMNLCGCWREQSGGDSDSGESL